MRRSIFPFVSFLFVLVLVVPMLSGCVRPTTSSIGAGANGETPTGSDMEVKHFMQLLTLEAAERLAYDRNVEADQ